MSKAPRSSLYLFINTTRINKQLWETVSKCKPRGIFRKHLHTLGAQFGSTSGQLLPLGFQPSEPDFWARFSLFGQFLPLRLTLLVPHSRGGAELLSAFSTRSGDSDLNHKHWDVPAIPRSRSACT